MQGISVDQDAGEAQLPARPSKIIARLKRLAPRLILSGVVFILMLRLVDFFWGAAFQTPTRYLLRLSPKFRQRHVSAEFDYEFQTNRLGLRGPEIPFEKPVNTTRIVVIGDSFVAGNGVSEDATFPSQLQKLRNSSPFPGTASETLTGQKTEVINLGCTGISTIRSFDLYRILGRKFQPELVILCYYVGNDLTGIRDEQTPQEFAAWCPAGFPAGLAYRLAPNLYLEWKMKRPTPTIFGRVLRRHSEAGFPIALEELAVSAGYDPILVGNRYLAIPQAIRTRVERGQLSEHRVLLACFNPQAQRQALFPTPELMQVAWPKTTEYLEKFQNASAVDGTRFVLVVIPTACQVDGEALEFNRKLGYDVDASWLQSTCETTRLVSEWAKSHGVPTLDLTDPFRRSLKKLYFTEDTHLTPIGQELLAKLLNDFINQRKLLTPQ